jgi:iron(III) transport system permease protein
VRTLLGRLRASGPLIPLAAILVVLVGLPLALLVLTSFIDVAPRPGAGLGSFTLDNYAQLAGPGNLNAAWNSLVISLFGTALAMLIGGLTGWLAARTDVPFRGLAQLAGIVPLFMSALVGTLAWALIASPRAGYINVGLEALGIGMTVNIYSMGGIVFVMGLFYAPYAFLLINSALTLMNPELEEAGSVHGGTMRRILGKVTFPIVTPAVAGSAILTFVLISENFPVVQILGSAGSIETLPARLFRLMVASPQRANEAAALGIALLVLLSVIIYAQRRLISRRSYVTVSGKGFRPRKIRLGRWRWPAFAFVVAYLMLAVVLPYFALLESALRRHQFLDGFLDLFDGSAFGMQNFTAAAGYRPFQEGLQNSLIVALATAVLGGALHFVLAYVVRRTTIPGRGLLEYVTNVPLAVPALVLGMGFLWSWLRLPVPVYGTLVILVMAFVARFLPQGFQGVSSTIVQVDKDLEDAAIVAGAKRRRAVSTVTLPLVKTGVVSTMLLLFILSFRELSAALFLFTSDTRTLSVVIYDQWESGQWPRVAAMSLMYSLVLLVVTLVGRRWFGLRG